MDVSSEERQISDMALSKLKPAHFYSILTGIGLLAAILIAVVLAAAPGCDDGSDGLKQVTVIFRHGERAPRTSYPTDPYSDKWEEGMDELTLVGKAHMFHLGQALRDRYQSLLACGYHNRQLKVMSSSIERCLMSAQALVAGLMPPTLEQRLNPDLNWQPIPVHYLPPEQDAMLLQTKHCPRFEKEFEVTMSSPEMESLNTASREMFDYLSKNTGKHVNNVMDAVEIYDTLVSQNDHGLEVPEWAKPVSDKLQMVASKTRSLYTNSVIMKRLRGGPLLREIVSQIQRKMNNPDDPSGKIFLYAVHEQTIHDLMRSMGFEDLLEVDYGSCIIFELYQVDGGKKWIIKVKYYQMKNLPEPRSLDVPGCGDECEVEEFVKSLIPVIPEDYEEECKV